MDLRYHLDQRGKTELCEADGCQALIHFTPQEASPEAVKEVLEGGASTSLPLGTYLQRRLEGAPPGEFPRKALSQDLLKAKLPLSSLEEEWTTVRKATQVLGALLLREEAPSPEGERALAALFRFAKPLEERFSVATDLARKAAPISREEAFAVFRRRAGERPVVQVRYQEDGRFLPGECLQEERGEERRRGWSFTGESLDYALKVTPTGTITAWTVPEVTGHEEGAFKALIYTPGAPFLVELRQGYPSPVYINGEGEFLRRVTVTKKGEVEESFHRLSSSDPASRPSPQEEGISREAFEGSPLSLTPQEVEARFLALMEEYRERRGSYDGPAYDCTMRVPPLEVPVALEPGDPRGGEREDALLLRDALGAPLPLRTLTGGEEVPPDLLPFVEVLRQMTSLKAGPSGLTGQVLLREGERLAKVLLTKTPHAYRLQVTPKGEEAFSFGLLHPRALATFLRAHCLPVGPA